MIGTRFCALRAHGVREVRFFMNQFILLILTVQVSNKSFLSGLCSDQNTFLCAAGARRAQSGIFFHGSISFAETVPTRYRTPVGGVWKFVWFRRQGCRQGGRDPDRENGHYENIYIDNLIWNENSGPKQQQNSTSIKKIYKKGWFQHFDLKINLNLFWYRFWNRNCNFSISKKKSETLSSYKNYQKKIL